MIKKIYLLPFFFFFSIFSMVEEIDLAQQLNFSDYDCISAIDSFSPQKIYFTAVVDQKEKIFCFDLNKKTSEAISSGYKEITDCLKTFEAQKKLIHSTYEGRVYIYDLDNEAQDRFLRFSNIENVFISPSGKFIILCRGNDVKNKDEVILYSLNKCNKYYLPCPPNLFLSDFGWDEEKPLKAFINSEKDLSKEIETIAYQSGIANDDLSLCIYKYDPKKLTEERLHNIPIKGSVGFLKFSNDSKSLFVLSKKDTKYIIILIGIHSNKSKTIEFFPNEQIVLANFSHCDDYIIMASKSGSISFIDIQTGAYLENVIKIPAASLDYKMKSVLQKSFFASIRDKKIFLFKNMEKKLDEDSRKNSSADSIKWNFPKQNIAKLLASRELGRRIKPQF